MAARKKNVSGNATSTFLSKSNNYCSVPQCKSRKSETVSLHLFPKEKQEMKKWIHKLKIGKKVSKYMVACSLHFKDEDFILPGVPTLKRRLKKGSVPSACLPVTTHSKLSSASTTTRDKRVANRHSQKQDALEITRVTKNLESIETPLPMEGALSVEETDGTDLTGGQIEPMCENCLSRNKQKATKHESVQVNAIDTSLPFNILDILKTDHDMYKFTGIASCELFHAIVKCVDVIATKKTNLPTEGTVLLVLMKMKLGLSFNVLANFFAISESSCRRYFQETVFDLANVLRTAITWPDKNEVMNNLPSCFQKFKATRVVLDCTEISVQQPKCLRCRILTYSQYKGCHTVKFLIGVSPAGLITFLSEAYGGRASDKFITNNTGILARLEPYIDAVMVDKGFAIDDECCDLGINLIRPPFVKGVKQLSANNAKQNAEIAKARVHVERAIGRLKRYSILCSKLDWQLLPYINAMMEISTGVVNLSSPILSAIRF